MARAWLITGGNSGDVAKRLAEALRMIAAEAGRIAAYSSVRSSEAWGFSSEPFLNQAVEIETALTPEALLERLQAIEQALGRDRDAERHEKERTGQRYASRPVDIDILFYDDEIIETPRLTIPHPAIGERAFVLEPLAEIAPHKVHPLTGLTVEQTAQRLKNRKL